MASEDPDDVITISNTSPESDNKAQANNNNAKSEVASAPVHECP